MKQLVMVFGIVCLMTQTAFGIQWPVGSPENYQYGYLFAEQTVSGRHLGVDILLTPGTEIKAPCDATIVIAKVDSTTMADPSQGLAQPPNLGHGVYMI